MDGVILLDDELYLLAQIPQQQQLMMNHPQPPPSSSRKATNKRPVQNAPRGNGGRRTRRNGTRILPAADMIPQFVAAAEPSQVQMQDPDGYGSSVIVDGQDVFYIQEVQEDVSDQAVLVPDNEPEVLQYMQPDTMVPGYVEEAASVDTPELNDVEQELDDAEEYYKVEPLELSDIWNDLITANQEILILLELSDLKAHIVDARKIEEKIRDMGCEYCGRIFKDIQAWDRHVRKIHFQTELFECDSCEGKFKLFARFKDHLNGHTGQRVYQCDECNHQYAFRMGFLVHKILDHMKLNGIYVCPKCDLDCHNAQNYKLHIASHIEFGPSVQSSSGLDARPVSTTTAASATAVAARSSSHNVAPKSNPANTMMAVRPPFYAKENERNKFLNVFESFSKTRKTEQQLPAGVKRKKFN